MKFKDYDKKIGVAILILGVWLLFVISAINSSQDDRISYIERFIESQRTVNSDRLNEVMKLNETIDVNFKKLVWTSFMSYASQLNDTETKTIGNLANSFDLGCIFAEFHDFQYEGRKRFEWYLNNPSRRVLFNDTAIICHGAYGEEIDCKAVCYGSKATPPY